MGSRSVSVQIRTTEPDLLLMTLDATPRETFSFSQEATEHPVEVGADIADHIRRKPDGLSLEGIISNTPIKAGHEIIADALVAEPGKGTRTSAALQALLSLEGRTCVVLTEFRKYTDMVCLSVEIARSPTTSDVLAFTASFRQIRRVQTATIRLSRATSKVLHGRPPENRGPKPAAKAPEAVKDKSITAGGVDAVVDAVKSIVHFAQ